MDDADRDKLKRIADGLAVAEHIGDVARYFDDIAALIGCDDPKYGERWERYIWPWEEERFVVVGTSAEWEGEDD